MCLSSVFAICFTQSLLVCLSSVFAICFTQSLLVCLSSVFAICFTQSLLVCLSVFAICFTQSLLVHLLTELPLQSALTLYRDGARYPEHVEINAKGHAMEAVEVGVDWASSLSVHVPSHPVWGLVDHLGTGPALSVCTSPVSQSGD